MCDLPSLMSILTAMFSMVLCGDPARVHATTLRYGHLSLASNDEPAQGFDLPLPGRYTARAQAPYAGELENGYPIDLSNERIANAYVTHRFPLSLHTAGVDTGNGQVINVPEAPEDPGEIPPYVPDKPVDRRDYTRPAGVRNGIRIRMKDNPMTTASSSSLSPAPAPAGNAEELGADVGAKFGKKLGSKAGASAGSVLGPGGYLVGNVVGGMVGSAVGKSIGTKVGAHVDKKIEEHKKEEAPREDTPKKDAPTKEVLIEEAPKENFPASAALKEEASSEKAPKEEALTKGYF